MENKTAEEIELKWSILKEIFWVKEEEVGLNEVQRNSLMYKDIEMAMEEYASIKLAEKDKEIERLKQENMRFQNEQNTILSAIDREDYFEVKQIILNH